MTAVLENGYGYKLQNSCVVVRSVTSSRDAKAIFAKAKEVGAILGDSYAVSFLMFPINNSDPKDPGSPQWRSKAEVEQLVRRARHVKSA